MAEALGNLQTRYLNIVNKEFTKRDEANALHLQNHNLWQTNVTTRIAAINAALVAGGFPANHITLEDAILAYRNALGNAVDPLLVTPLIEPLNTYEPSVYVKVIKQYGLITSAVVVCGLAASMIED